MIFVTIRRQMVSVLGTTDSIKAAINEANTEKLPVYYSYNHLPLPGLVLIIHGEFPDWVLSNCPYDYHIVISSKKLDSASRTLSSGDFRTLFSNYINYIVNKNSIRQYIKNHISKIVHNKLDRKKLLSISQVIKTMSDKEYAVNVDKEFSNNFIYTFTKKYLKYFRSPEYYHIIQVVFSGKIFSMKPRVYKKIFDSARVENIRYMPKKVARKFLIMGINFYYGISINAVNRRKIDKMKIYDNLLNEATKNIHLMNRLPYRYLIFPSQDQEGVVEKLLRYLDIFREYTIS